MKYFFVLIIFVLVAGFLISLPSTSLTPENIGHVVLAGQSIKVDLAISEESQVRGLSGRASLPAGEGMLFVFDQPGKHMFWMQGMQFPIDIIWITENMQVVHFEKSVAPTSFPERFGPDAYVKYVLEVPAGFAEKNNLQVGNTVMFTD